MKKLYTLVVAVLAVLGSAHASNCTIDTSNHSFLAPSPDSLPCVTRTVPYQQTLQIYAPDSINLQTIVTGIPFAYFLTVDSLVIDSVTGLPTGISVVTNPTNGHIYGGQNACGSITGTTTDTVGHYNLLFHGTLTLHGAPINGFFDGDTTVDLAVVQSQPNNPFRAFLEVIAVGGTCTHLPVVVPPICVVDHSNTAFLSPSPDSLPCIEKNNAYSQVLQVYVPVSINLQQLIPSLPIPFTLYIDSLVLTGVDGLPTNITYQLNPASGHIYGGQGACALLSGTTTDTVGHYPLTFQGSITLHGTAFPPFFDGDTTVDLAYVQSQPQNPFHAFVDVINAGDPCIHPSTQGTGINDFSQSLNASLFIYPNPSNGVFELKLNAGRRVNGEIAVVDVTGRTIYSEKLDAIGLYNSTINISKFAKGIYTIQVRTADGFASKNISVE